MEKLDILSSISIYVYLLILIKYIDYIDVAIKD